MQHRDAYCGWAGQQRLIITTDNAANIGPAATDQLAVAPYTVGYLTARVAALEAVALGATPLAVSSTLSYDYQSPAGQELTAGILAVMTELGLAAAALTGSCETNFPAATTCLGVTVVALAQPDALLLGKVRAGDGCYLWGTPLVGQAVLQAYPQLPDVTRVQQLASWPEVSELLPIGSQGVAQELARLTQAYGLRLQPSLLPEELWQQSAGPATCLLLIGRPPLAERLQTLGIKATLLGLLH